MSRKPVPKRWPCEVLRWLALEANDVRWGECSWVDDEGTSWCVDVAPDGTAYTYARDYGMFLLREELPEERTHVAR